jgi:hypothetical protein
MTGAMAMKLAATVLERKKTCNCGTLFQTGADRARWFELPFSPSAIAAIDGRDGAPAQAQQR